MNGKRKSRARLGLLDRALRALEGRFPVVRRDRSVIFVGSDGIVVSRPGEKKLRLRFWTGAQQEFKLMLTAALHKDRVPFELGQEYDLQDKGKVIDAKPALLLMGGTGEETIGRLERTPHARACLVCKELLDQAASGDAEYQQSVYAVVLGHIKIKPSIEVPSCSYAGCVHHEDISREMSRALLKMVAGNKPWKDARGVPVATLPLIAKEDDHPKGWAFKRQDAESRAFKNLPTEEAGTIYIRLAPKKVTVHVWIEPQYKTKHEDLESPATVEDVLETFAVRVPALREWALAKYNDLKGLAEMDLDLEKK